MNHLRHTIKAEINNIPNIYDDEYKGKIIIDWKQSLMRLLFQVTLWTDGYSIVHQLDLEHSAHKDTFHYILSVTATIDNPVPFFDLTSQWLDSLIRIQEEMRAIPELDAAFKRAFDEVCDFYGD